MAGLLGVLLHSSSLVFNAYAVKIIVWQDEGDKVIRRANIDGSNVVDIIRTQFAGTGLAVDFRDKKVYWTSVGGGQSIQRVNLDGTGYELLVTSGLVVPLGIALDLHDGKMYWTDQGPSKISRANLDGTNVESLVTSVTVHPHDIALDVVKHKMYWTDSHSNKILRADLNGKNVEELATLPDNPSPRGLAIDQSRKMVFWNAQGSGLIQCSNLDGSNIVSVVSVPGWNGPDGIALDVQDGKLYWTGLNQVRKIQRANLDGTKVEDVITTGLSIPRGIDVGEMEIAASIPAISATSETPELARIKDTSADHNHAVSLEYCKWIESSTNALNKLIQNDSSINKEWNHGKSQVNLVQGYRRATSLSSWVSVNGKYKVEAKYVGANSEIVRLKSADGKSIHVPLEKLDRRSVLKLYEIKQRQRELILVACSLYEFMLGAEHQSDPRWTFILQARDILPTASLESPDIGFLSDRQWKMKAGESFTGTIQRKVRNPSTDEMSYVITVDKGVDKVVVRKSLTDSHGHNVPRRWRCHHSHQPRPASVYARDLTAAPSTGESRSPEPSRYLAGDCNIISKHASH